MIGIRELLLIVHKTALCTTNSVEHALWGGLLYP